MICKPWDVVVVPFPFTDRQANKRRPALALSSEKFSADSRHTLLTMITSADNPPWPFDVHIDHAAAGLHAESKVRLKLFTLDNRLILRRAGSLKESDCRAIAETLSRALGTQAG